MTTTKAVTYITSYKVFLKVQIQNVAQVTLQNNYVKSLTRHFLYSFEGLSRVLNINKRISILHCKNARPVVYMKGLLDNPRT